MRCKVLTVSALAAMILSVGAVAQVLEADAKDLAGVMRTLSAAGATESPLVYKTSEGFLRFLGAPPDGHFEVDATAKSAASTAAEQFIGEHRGAFGMVSGKAGVRVLDTRSLGARVISRMQQLYGTVPVFGAQILVQSDANGNVLLVNSDIATDLRSLDTGAVSLTPRVDAAQAGSKALAAVAARSENVAEGDLSVTDGPELMVYAPSVLGQTGALRLVWRVEVYGDEEHLVQECVLIDAQSGQETFHYSKIPHGRYRVLYDLQNQLYVPALPTRVESQPPVGIPEVDTIYEYFGDVYDYFYQSYAWDNFDNGTERPPAGFTFLPIMVLVRYPELNASFIPFGSNSMFVIGTGLGVDDVIGHEFTHGVTEYTSQLIYQGFSGAINESFSDIWGEFVDLTNGAGNDDAEVRWDMGEDVPAEIISGLSSNQQEIGLRNMKDPTVFGDPDRLNSPLLYPVDSAFDNGGVHFNSGIGNKLCYLLTDGDEFNGQKVTGFGIETVSDLYWECQNILTPSADYHDLYYALMAGSINLGLSRDARLNVLAACLAVEIVPDSQTASFRAIAAQTDDAQPAIAVSWQLADDSGENDVLILRSTLRYAYNEMQGEAVYEGNLDRFLDIDVVPGIEYFYTLIQDLGADGIVLAYANAVAGADGLNVLTEAFGDHNPLDLENTQLLFTPVGAPVNSLSQSAVPTGYERYELTRTANVTELPVSRSGQGGNALSLSFLEDGLLSISLAKPVPFFGRPQQTLYLSSNGYIAFQPVDKADSNNFASLAAHFALPRISFLFGDLAPNLSGEVWMRDLGDRIVFTFQEVPEFTRSSFPMPPGNTVQIELFQNGQIRLTYGQLTMSEAIVGLSDGRGVPVPPAEQFENVAGVVTYPSLSASSLNITQLRIEPIAAAYINAGGRVTFEARAVAPVDAIGVPQFVAEWTGPGAVPFADFGNGSGRFDWQSGINDEGVYTVRVLATLGPEAAFQDVPIQIGDVFLKPVALDLELATGTPLEDPTQDRNIAPGLPLYASYTYSQPQANPDDPFDSNNEAFSWVYWYRNSGLVPGLTNRISVPPALVHGGEQWWFTVVPVSGAGVRGSETFSPKVTVLAVPEVLSVTPNFGEVTGGDRVTITGAKLNGPLLVTFGGIKADEVIALSDSKLEVVSPLHVAGTVDVAVRTARGTGLLRGAFTFTPDAAKVPNPDVNGDGVVNALDVQTVINVILAQSKSSLNADVNRDGSVNALDMQAVVNAAIYR